MIVYEKDAKDEPKNKYELYRGRQDSTQTISHGEISRHLDNKYETEQIVVESQNETSYSSGNNSTAKYSSFIKNSSNN